VRLTLAFGAIRSDGRWLQGAVQAILAAPRPVRGARNLWGSGAVPISETSNDPFY